MIKLPPFLDVKLSIPPLILVYFVRRPTTEPVLNVPLIPLKTVKLSVEILMLVPNVKPPLIG